MFFKTSALNILQGFFFADWNNNANWSLGFVPGGADIAQEDNTTATISYFMASPPAISGLIMEGDVKDLKIITVGKSRILLSAVNDSKIKAFAIQ